MAPLLPKSASVKLRHLVVFFLISICFFACLRLSAQVTETGFENDVVYFKTTAATHVIPSLQNPSADLAPLITDYEITNIRHAFHTPDPELLRIYKVEFNPNTNADELVSRLGSLSWVEYAERSPVYKVDYTPDDFSSSLQWGLTKIDAPLAWDISKGSADVKIAIVDNGVNYMHQDLAE